MIYRKLANLAITSNTLTLQPVDVEDGLHSWMIFVTLAYTYIIQCNWLSLLSSLDEIELLESNYKVQNAT